MAKAKTKAAGTNLRVPQNDAEAEQMIAELGASQRDQVEAKARHDAQVAALEEGHGKLVQGFRDTQTALTEGLSLWAAAHRERLTEGGKTKTVQLASGKILWRDGRHSVKHRGLKNDDVVQAIFDRIEAVEATGAEARRNRRKAEVARLIGEIEILQGFLRTKVEPNKDAMLAARETAERIPGITVPRGPEEFVVEPLASQISEVA